MLLVVIAISELLSVLLRAENADSAGAATVTSKDNRVESAKNGGGWSPASVGETLAVGDRIRTGEDSRATVRVSDGSVLEMDEMTTIEIKPPKEAGTDATLSVPRGAGYFFSQGQSHQVSVETPSANGAIRGTAFLLTVNAVNGRTAVAMIEGAFELSTNGGSIIARQGEKARAGVKGLAKNHYADRGDTAPWYLVLENQLPAVQSLRRASKTQFLASLPAAIKKYPQIAPHVAGGATMTHKEWARDILKESFKAVGPDCGMRGWILQSLIAADPEEAAALTELATAVAPGCASSFGGGGAGGADESGGEDEESSESVSASSNSSFQSLYSGGGGQQNLSAICHNGRTIFVSPVAVERRLRDHPGDTLGPCAVTPVQNR